MEGDLWKIQIYECWSRFCLEFSGGDLSCSKDSQVEQLLLRGVLVG